MQKWEYCAIAGVSKRGSGLYPRYPALIQFTLQGCVERPIKGDEINLLAQTIAHLGEQGWEMVGTGAHSLGSSLGSGTTETNHIIYFKRPKP